MMFISILVFCCTKSLELNYIGHAWGFASGYYMRGWALDCMKIIREINKSEKK